MSEREVERNWEFIGRVNLKLKEGVWGGVVSSVGSNLGCFGVTSVQSTYGLALLEAGKVANSWVDEKIVGISVGCIES